jgi:uridine kinase
MDKPKLLITIAGPCASGKTTIALLIERVLRFNGLTTMVNDIDLPDDREEHHKDVNLQKRRLKGLADDGAEIEIVCVQTQRQ